MAGLFKKKNLENAGVDCCLCNRSIYVTATDPCDLDVLCNVERPKSEDEQKSQFFWCHMRCFRRKVHFKLRKSLKMGSTCLSKLEKFEYSLNLLIDHLRSIFIKTKSNIPEHFNQEEKHYIVENYSHATCCFCDNFMIPNSIDPSEINIRTAWSSSQKHRKSKLFLCHLECFKKKMHPNVRIHLVVGILAQD